ncbi:hypothetical protein VTJ49DRAFT_1806 [Mycothermus thermophilus]|uniref:Zn(2)-C6 fungal-type domain-containing protein n=1 Tax=Humicola insolens TaxID=85995 RepID=A0ABR3VBN4_HUMIN
MASASVSSGASPLSAFEFEFEFPQHQQQHQHQQQQHNQQQQQQQQQQQHHYPDSTSDADDAFWATSGSLSGYMSSPAANSIGSSWVVLGSGSQGQAVELVPSPAALPSPLGSSSVDFDRLSPFATATSGVEHGSVSSAGGVFGDPSMVTLGDVNFLTQGLAHDDPLGFLGPAGTGFVFDQSLNINEDDMDAVMHRFAYESQPQQLPHQQPAAVSLESPRSLRSPIDGSTWETVNLPGDRDQNNNQARQNRATPPQPSPVAEASPIFIIEDPSFVSPSPPAHPLYSPSMQSASSLSPSAIASPRSPVPPQIQPQPQPTAETLHKSQPSSSSSVASLTSSGGSSGSGSGSITAPKPIPTRTKKLNPQHRVQKRKAPAAPNPSPTGSALLSAASSLSSSPSPTPSSSTQSQNKFLIVTPSSITAAAAAAAAAANNGSSGPAGSGTTAPRPSLNPFDCLDALSRGPTQRGRKGPLATDTKQSALVVRRMGACFSCHARKVKCDKERPCRSCVRLATSVPGVVCWQFGDFTPVLFPAFIRSHLRRDEVVKFVEGNVQCFSVGGQDIPCKQWHMIAGRNGMDLVSRGAAPIGLEMPVDGKQDGPTAGDGAQQQQQQRAELKRRVREYVQAMVDEPRFAELVTPPPQHTDLPRKVLRIVHAYARRCDSPMVRRALSIYAMHFVMTRHLCLTPANIAELQPTGLVPQGVPWVTPRVLNRQIKSVVDDIMCREMQVLFENFTKSLKPKLRREWAPCLASFLVLCLFMETVEVAADMFVVSDNDIQMRGRYPPAWKRSFVLDVNGQIENMPFRQFAFQFHQIYQTHSRDATARSFNPLVDDVPFDQGELDPEAEDMVRQLRGFIRDDWAELDYLTADPVVPKSEDQPYPTNLAYNYTGRLLAKFLLSFTDEKYIFDGKT